MEVQNARRGRAEAGHPFVNPRAERAHGADHNQAVDLAGEAKIPERPQGRSGFARTRNAEVRRFAHGAHEERVPHLTIPQRAGHHGVNRARELGELAIYLRGARLDGIAGGGFLDDARILLLLSVGKRPVKLDFKLGIARGDIAELCEHGLDIQPRKIRREQDDLPHRIQGAAFDRGKPHLPQR